MPASLINENDPTKADVVLLGANYDVTSSFGKGADRGPSAIIACLDRQIEFYERTTRTTPVDHLKIAYNSLGDLNNVSPEVMVERIRAEHAKFFEQGKFVFLLGGEHSVTNGPFKSIAAHTTASSITILYIDAHFDLRNTDADYRDEPYGQYAHSCVLRRGVELGYRVVHVGARAYSEEEYEFAKVQGVTSFEWGAPIPPPPSAIVQAIPTQNVYISIDVDGFDPAHMPATGTPVQGGLEWHYAFRLLQELFDQKNIIGADIVEVAPRSSDKLTEYGAAQLVYSMIAYYALQRKRSS